MTEVIARLDRVGRRDADAYRHPDGEPELVGEHDVRRVGDGDEQGAVLEELDRQRAVAARERLGQKERRGLIDRPGVEIDERELVLLGEHARDRAGIDESLLGQDLAEPPLRLRTLKLERALELRLGDGSVAEEERAQSRPLVPWLPHDFHGCPIGRSAPSVE